MCHNIWLDHLGCVLSKQSKKRTAQLLYEAALLLAGTFIFWWFSESISLTDNIIGFMQTAQAANVDALIHAGTFMMILLMARAWQYCRSRSKKPNSTTIAVAQSGPHLVDIAVAENSASLAQRRAQDLFDETSEDASFSVQEDLDHLEHKLRSAIARRELTVHFQPYFCVNSNRIAGYEALARWPQRDGNFIPPSIFIDVAEKTGQINELSALLFEIACKEAREWPDHLTLSFNISALQLHTEDFANDILSFVNEWQLPPERLELELTESKLVIEGKRACKALADLREAGVRIALDDLGTGYSSFLRLSKMPVDKLKIDRHFIAECQEDHRVKKIVEAMISLGKGLGASIVAEGVETEEQLYIVQHMGCDIAQGFLLGTPRDAQHVNHDISYEASVVVPLSTRLRAG